jgi:type IV secretory pathway VirB4 component
MVVVDEAWLLLRDGEGARFLFRMSKAARNAGLTVVTQDVSDVLGTDLGHAVVANAATQILLKQAPQAIDTVGDAFGLTAGERRLLLSTRTGHGLLVSGTNRTAFEAVSSQTEHLLCTTDPGFDISEDPDGLN